jgi:hypothetical protein
MALADAVRDQWLPYAQSSKALSIACDESTTCSFEGSLIIYVKFLMHGVATTRFWKLVQVSDGSAATIFEALQRAFLEDDLDTNAVYSMSTDGASAMLGSTSGVATRCKTAWNGAILVVHCIAHREYLAVGDAYASNAEAVYFERQMRDILHYYKDSTVRRSSLCQLQHDLGIKELALLKLHTVRWLSRAGAAARILHNWPALVREFESDTDTAVRAKLHVNPLLWQSMGQIRPTSPAKPLEGVPLLAEKLAVKTALTEKEWSACRVSDLKAEHYVEVKVAGTVSFFQPMLCVEQHAAGAIHASITTHRFLVGLCGFVDILEKMALLSRLFQQQLIRYRYVVACLDATKSALQHAYIEPPASRMAGRQYGELRSAIRAAEEVRSFRFRGVSVSYDPQGAQVAMTGVKQLARDLISNLNARFPDNRVLSALQIFDPRELPPTRSQWLNTASTYGRDHLSVLVSTFGKPLVVGDGSKAKPAVINGQRLMIEWSIFVERMANAWYEYCEKKRLLQKGKVAVDQADATFIEMFYASQLDNDDGGDCILVASIWLTQFVSTVDCERGFSAMALIKTRLRNRMHVRTLDALMQIAICGPDMSEQHDVNKVVDMAYAIWVRTATRNVRKSHIGSAGRKPKTPTTTAEDLLNEIGAPDEDLPLYVRELRGEEHMAGKAGEGGEAGEVGEADEAVEAGESGAAGDTAHQHAQQKAIYQAVAPYAPPPDRKVLDAPTTDEWAAAIKTTAWWVRKRVVAKWDNGWYEGSFWGSPYAASSKDAGKFEVFYQGRYDDGVAYRESRPHELALADYGFDRLWVIVEVPPTARKQRAAGTASETTQHTDSRKAEDQERDARQKDQEHRRQQFLENEQRERAANAARKAARQVEDLKGEQGKPARPKVSNSGSSVGGGSGRGRGNARGNAHGSSCGRGKDSGGGSDGRRGGEGPKETPATAAKANPSSGAAKGVDSGGDQRQLQGKVGGSQSKLTFVKAGALGQTTERDCPAPNQQIAPPSAAASKASFDRELNDVYSLPPQCLIEAFDVEHTGKGNMFEVEVYELGSASLEWRSAKIDDRVNTVGGGSCRSPSSDCHSSQGGAAVQSHQAQLKQTGFAFRSLVRSTAEMGSWSKKNLAAARITAQMLAAAPTFSDVISRWLRRLKDVANGRPVVLAAHDAFNTDMKTLVWGMRTAGMDPYDRLREAGVVAVLETRRVCKLLPSNIQTALQNAHKQRLSKDKQTYGAQSNRSLYEALAKPCPSLNWHQASDDAVATARWLSSCEGTELFVGGVGDSLIRLEQVVLMIYSKASHASALRGRTDVKAPCYWNTPGCMLNGKHSGPCSVHVATEGRRMGDAGAQT